jgi:histone H1/5
MKAALKRGVDTGVLVQVKASYKLSPEAKKKSAAVTKAKTTVKKTTTAKKAAPKKKVRFYILKSISCSLVAC